MPYKLLIGLLLTVLAPVWLHAQGNDVYDKYLDFNLAQLEGRTADAYKLGSEVLQQTDKLPEKARIAFYNRMAKLYEDDNKLTLAAPLYEKVTLAAPNYYVAHMALGNIYLRFAEMYAAKFKADANDQTSADLYRQQLQKALPHLEKAQACDPNAEALKQIKDLLIQLDDKQGLNALPTRLSSMAKNCEDILDDN